SDGAFPDPYHHALCPTRTPGCLARICPRRRQAHSLEPSGGLMSQSPSLEQILETHLQTLALTLRPSTVSYYRYLTHGFLRYLHADFRQLAGLPNLRRHPPLLGCSRWLCALHPPLCNQTPTDYLVRLRRLLDALAANGPPLPPDLIRREDFPPRPHYLP